MNITDGVVAIPFGGRMMLTDKDILGNWDPSGYFTPNLLGGSIEYDIFIGAKCKNMVDSDLKDETEVKHMPKGYGLF